MAQKIQPVRGTKDLLPTDFRCHEHVINIAKQLGDLYGFEPLATPIFEFTNVFDRTLGDTSDVVSKEMYSFEDRGGENITLRPEFTAAIVRSFISNGLHHQLPSKFFSAGPVFRYDRPQAGRYRQFHQLNFEYFGGKTPCSDAEIINLAHDILSKLGVMADITLEINSLGCPASRQKYQDLLVDYFSGYKNKLSEDSLKRLEKNPLRILDSKDKNDQEIAKNAPAIDESYSPESKQYFTEVLALLDNLDIKYEINPKLVRGLDYYNHTTFEFTTTKLGAQATVLAGGRYNGLIKQMGGPDVEAIGFAAGIERLILLKEPQIEQKRPNMIIPIGEDNIKTAMTLSRQLRSENIITIIEDSGKLAKRMQKANNMNAKFVLFLGDDEVKNKQAKLKDLDSGNEQEVTFAKLSKALTS